MSRESTYVQYINEIATVYGIELTENVCLIPLHTKNRGHKNVKLEDQSQNAAMWLVDFKCEFEITHQIHVCLGPWTTGSEFMHMKIVNKLWVKIIELN